MRKMLMQYIYMFFFTLYMYAFLLLGLSSPLSALIRRPLCGVVKVSPFFASFYYSFFTFFPGWICYWSFNHTYTIIWIHGSNHMSSSM